MKAKKILSGFLALLMLLTAVPFAYAQEECKHDKGTFVSKEAKEISTTEEYWTEEESCSVCGEVLVPSVVFPPAPMCYAEDENSWIKINDCCEKKCINENFEITSIMSPDNKVYHLMDGDVSIVSPCRPNSFGLAPYLAPYMDSLLDYCLTGDTDADQVITYKGMINEKRHYLFFAVEEKHCEIYTFIDMENGFFIHDMYIMNVPEESCESLIGKVDLEYVIDLISQFEYSSDIQIDEDNNHVTYISKEAVLPTAEEPGRTEERTCAICEQVIKASEEIPATVNKGQCGDNAYWEYDSETKTLTISGSGAMWDCEFEIIDHVGYNNRGWDMYKYKTKHIVIGDEIKRIGNYSFEDMLSVKTVYIGNSVESIGKYAFRSMLFLEKAVIPENVKTIEDYAFENSLYTEIILNDTVEVIGNGAFSECYKKMMTIPSTVKEIGTENFIDFSDNSHIVNKSTSITVIDENKIKYIQYIPETYFEKIIFMYEYSLSKADAFSSGDENEDEELTKEFLAICNEKYGMTFNNIEEFIDSAEEGAFKGEEVLSHLTIECLEDSAQHEQCKKLGIKHSIIGSTCDDTCGVHNIYENDYIAPTCTENGYKGGVVCLDCEKIFEAATIIPPKGHTETIQPGFAPTCTEPGCTDTKVCAVCGDVLEDVRLIQPKGHTDNDNNGICDECGDEIEGYEPEEVPETIAQKIINFFKGIVDAILALFRKLFG